MSINIHAQNISYTISESLNRYSIDLFKNTIQSNENLLLSPISSYLPLMAIYEGSDGQTLEELQNTLHLENKNIIHKIDSLTKKITDNSNNTSINISNAIWLNNSFRIKDSYKELLTKHYSANFANINFANKEQSSAEINDWVTDKTNGYIKNILSPNDISNETAMIVTNAIFFQGYWKEKFDSTLTNPDHFYTIEKNNVQIEFMHQTELFYYYETDKFQFVSLPYKDNQNYFCILLPKEKYGLQQIEKKLDYKQFNCIYSSTKKKLIHLSLPKFELESNSDLQKPLQSCGLKQIFTTKASLTGISEQKPLFINSIKHKTFISVDETKTIAAGATSVSMSTTSFNPIKSEPVEFKADHPFLFFIYNGKTNTILFMGRYVKN